MTFEEQQARFHRFADELVAAGILEPLLTVHEAHKATLYHEPVGAHDDGRERRPMFRVRWDPAPGAGKPHIDPHWRKGVCRLLPDGSTEIIDEDLRARYKGLYAAFLADIL